MPGARRATGWCAGSGRRPRPCRVASHGSRPARSPVRSRAADRRGGSLERQHGPANQGRSQTQRPCGESVPLRAQPHRSPTSDERARHARRYRWRNVSARRRRPSSPSNRSIRSGPRVGRHGAAGAIVAAGMFGLDQALGRKPKEEAPIVMAASDRAGRHRSRWHPCTGRRWCRR